MEGEGMSRMTDSQEQTYVMVFGNSCPVCESHGLFWVGDEKGEAVSGVEYRCETCLTRFDSEKRVVSNSFVSEAGLNEDRIQNYFGRWWEEDRIEIVRERLRVLWSNLYKEEE